jgi:hypothetical protein
VESRRHAAAVFLDIDSVWFNDSHQTELLGISRSSFYYKQVVDEYDLLLMQRIDGPFTRTPFCPSGEMAAHLRLPLFLKRKKGK